MDDPEPMSSDVPAPRAAATGDNFEDFYTSIWHDAARWATALVGDVATGEEIAQDSFLLVGERFADLDEPAAYLRRTIVNTARMHARSAARRSSREHRVAAGEPDAALDTTEGSPGDVQLLDVLAGLPYDRRAAVVLRYWADWSDDSIADALGCRPSTVRSHLRRGLRDLRIQLTDGDRP